METIVRTKQDYLNLLKETVEYYKTNPRGYNANANQCVYYDKITGVMCAVGRCLINPEKLGNFNGGIIPLNNEFGLESSLKEEYRGFSMYFWGELQGLHDSDFSIKSKKSCLKWIENKFPNQTLKKKH